jgi:hypothetical protein
MTESVINKVNMRKVSALGVQVRSLKNNIIEPCSKVPYKTYKKYNIVGTLYAMTVWYHK